MSRKDAVRPASLSHGSARDRGPVQAGAAAERGAPVACAVAPGRLGREELSCAPEASAATAHHRARATRCSWHRQPPVPGWARRAGQRPRSARPARTARLLLPRQRHPQTAPGRSPMPGACRFHVQKVGVERYLEAGVGAGVRRSRLSGQGTVSGHVENVGMGAGIEGLVLGNSRRGRPQASRAPPLLPPGCRPRLLGTPPRPSSCAAHRRRRAEAGLASTARSGGSRRCRGPARPRCMPRAGCSIRATRTGP